MRDIEELGRFVHESRRVSVKGFNSARGRVRV
jgi:hypothetical protein